MRNRISTLAASLTLAAAIVSLTVACTRDGNAQTEGRTAAIVRDDTASLTRLLAAVRGANPMLCELAARTVDGRGGWSGWFESTGGPLEVDSVSSALIDWVRERHNDPVVVPRLSAAMRDSDACVRRIAGSFLGRVHHPSAVAALVAALEDANADTRQAAAVGLGISNKETRPIEPLVKHLRDESPLVRRSVAWALGSLEVNEAMTPLIETLQRDSDPRVRQAAAWALGQISK
jgi:hypothetical protein